jgi:anti-sigma factor RsiW
MSCRKVSRALLERFRFGELDADCDAYLAHLERCRDCQDEIAVDRELAERLRLALRERVTGFEPSPAVWRAVRLQAADPEPPNRWSTLVVSLSRGMRVMVPAAALLLAAVLAWTRPVSDAGPSLTSALASRMQWEEQLTDTASVAEPEREIEVIPSPSIQLPVPSGEMAYAELVTSIKLPSGTPTTGGLIR